MHEKATIARPYARAAFEQALEEGALKEWSGMLALLSAVVSDPLMCKVIGNPRLSADGLSGLVIDVCGARLSETGRNFVKLLVEADRLAVAPEICEQFEVKRAHAEGISHIEITSAFELDDAQEKRIQAIMKKRIGRDVDVAANVDRDIIGGVIIRAGDSVVDASIRGRLRELRNELFE